MALSRGFDQVDKDFQDLSDRREKLQAMRFSLKANCSANVVFLDDEPVRIEEYQKPFRRDSRPEYAVKPDGQRDRFMAAGYEARPKYVFSIIDCSLTHDKNGKEHQNEKKLLVVSTDIAKLLREKRTSWGGLKHKAVTIRRLGDKTAGSGSDFELMMKNGAVQAVNMKAFKDVEPFNYEKIFAALSDDDAIRTIARWNQSSGNNAAVPLDDGPSLPSDHDAPPSGAPAEMSAGDDSIPF